MGVEGEGLAFRAEEGTSRPPKFIRGSQLCQNFTVKCGGQKNNTSFLREKVTFDHGVGSMPVVFVSPQRLLARLGILSTIPNFSYTSTVGVLACATETSLCKIGTLYTCGPYSGMSKNSKKLFQDVHILHSARSKPNERLEKKCGR